VSPIALLAGRDSLMIPAGDNLGSAGTGTL
jgi:hypothetical protein